MKLKIALGLAALVSTSAAATPFFLDMNVDYGGNANTANGATTTGWLDELQFAYNSWSTVVDSNGNGTIDAGDVITSTGGLLGSGFNFGSDFSNNMFTSLLPVQTGPIGPSNNNYLNSWNLAFGFNDLVGTVQGDGSVNWNSGTISMFVTTDLGGCIGSASLSCYTQVFDMNVTFGGDIGNGTIIQGYLDNFNKTDQINGVDAGSIFWTDYQGANTSFSDIYDDQFLAGMAEMFRFIVDQNTQALPNVIGYDGTTFTLAKATHSGRVSFSVPEPTSLAILGLGLLGMGFRGRMKRRA
ncbi:MULTISPECIES: PEP-CTERM sorting domain-containing protein [Alkalimonas]|uniref:PEP-CTERM sorting domain-containing protein n=1 Tax=Alkalimonas mucilaginosa TaxID=3057676 RepID=A0ABU7JCI7_9GAMM|nr:PEP-CTERM sorting domain-containing protein [Alkalimonas sp. MEB004]MEE2022885.1 PEP-CTERM sorting domain-containing protein [Alkalimonas sp. MEB004]